MHIGITLRNVGTTLGLHRGKSTSKDNNKSHKRFAEVYLQEIERRRRMVSSSTIENELTAYRSFLAFAGHGFLVCELTSDHVLRYERWLRDRGVSPNTSACYMRSLRAVTNRLGLNGSALFQEVRTAKDKTEKKAVNAKTIQKIMAAKVPDGSFLALARDAFLFSIMAMGIPFVDLVHLKKSNLRDGAIVYNRRKTGRRVAVKIEPCMQEIINRYNDPTSPYLFPLLTETEPAKAETEYKRLIGRYNRALKRLCIVSCVKTRVTSYTARHTWATLAYKMGMVLAYISKALGHASPVTTQNYLKDIDDEGLFNANKALIGKIFK